MDQQGDISTPCSTPIKGQSTASTSTSKGGPGGFDFTAPSHITQNDGERTYDYAFCAPLPTQKHSRHLCLFHEHLTKCVCRSPRAPPKVILELAEPHLIQQRLDGLTSSSSMS